MIIDSHCHLATNDIVAYPRAEAPPLETDDYVNTAENFLALMDLAGVAGALIVQAFGLYGFDNAYHADSVGRYPQRFAGVCGLSPELPDAPALLRYWICERGMAGVRLSYYGRDAILNPQDPRVLAFLCEADRLRVPVAVLTTRRNLSAIGSLARGLPSLNFLLDHLGVMLGDPARVEADLAALIPVRNVYLKFATPALNAGEPHWSFFKRIVDEFGVERLMWGSDFPHTDSGGYANMVASARARLDFLTAGEREQLFSGTALRLWPQLNSVSV